MGRKKVLRCAIGESDENSGPHTKWRMKLDQMHFIFYCKNCFHNQKWNWIFTFAIEYEYWWDALRMSGSGVVPTTRPTSPGERANPIHSLCHLFWPQSMWRLVSGIQIIFLRSILILAKLLLWKMRFKKNWSCCTKTWE